MADQLTRNDVLRWLQQGQAWGVLVAPTEWRPVDDEWLNLIHRAVLARWGNPAPQPAAVTGQPSDGEVAELTAWLRMQGEAQKPGPESLLSTKTKKEMRANGSRLIRAAEPLERLSPPQPVPVSKRPPGPEDCDAEGRCWWGTPSFVNCYSVMQSAQWRLSAPDDRFGSDVFWLPAHALPLPEVGE